MSTPVFSLQYNDSQVRDRLQTLLRKTGNLTPAMKEIGEYCLGSVDQRIDNEIDAQGHPFAPLSVSTLRFKTKNNRIPKILQSTGLLRSRMSYRAERDRCIVGNSANYAAFLQTGTKSMPPRPFLGVSQSDKTEIIAILNDHIAS